MRPFVDSREHLLAELERLDLLIRNQVARVRKLQAADEQFRGLYISEQEVDALLNQPVGRPYWMSSDQVGADDSEGSVERALQRLAQRTRLSLELGIDLRLHNLQARFHLSSLEVDILLVCLSAELDLRYERLFAYLQDDVTKKRPSVDLALNLLCSSAESKLEARRFLFSHATLVREQMVELVEDPAQVRSPLLAKLLKLDERIAAYLLGDDVFDTRLKAFSQTRVPEINLDDLLLDDHLKQGLLGLTHRRLNGESTFLYIHGPYGVGKHEVAEGLAKARGARLMVTDLRGVSTESVGAFGRCLDLVQRELRLNPAVICWMGFDALLVEQNKALLGVFLQHSQSSRGLNVIVGDNAWQPEETLSGVSFISLELRRPNFVSRSKIWRDVLESRSVIDVDFESLASKFKLTAGQIRDAAATAENLARWRDFEEVRITSRDLYEACRQHSNQRLSALAHKIVPKYRWGDIVLPTDRLSQLREICNHVKYRDRVYSDWGFDQKLAMGKGLCVLFAGPSGTGKTMAADIIAGELGLDLYKIDLSTVVSKYIGETEKNLSRIFTEAETSNAILFFDEADALFGKRSEVKDSHDRYANIETGYLLQRMEEHEGVVILASNFRKNMDDAFVRRLHFTVEFPFPNEEDRRRIWEGVWPDAVPRDPTLDMALLAGRFQMTGGNIRNIALSAAFLAADDGGSVAMRHLFLATQREYQKMGKVITDLEFSEHRYSSLAQ